MSAAAGAGWSNNSCVGQGCCDAHGAVPETANADGLKDNGSTDAVLDGSTTSDIHGWPQLQAFTASPAHAMASASPSTSEPQPSASAAAQPTRRRHANRSAAEEQPEPKPNPSGRRTQQWRVHAFVSRQGTGKAGSTQQYERSPYMFAATPAAALERQREYIFDFLNPVDRATPKRSAPVEPRQRQARRTAAPIALAEPNRARGPRPGTVRGGPGRGHTYESTRPIEEQLGPPEPTRGLNWIEKLALEKQWKTKRMSDLEQQVLQ
jgi:hypothetical protein